MCQTLTVSDITRLFNNSKTLYNSLNKEWLDTLYWIVGLLAIGVHCRLMDTRSDFRHRLFIGSESAAGWALNIFPKCWTITLSEVIIIFGWASFAIQDILCTFISHIDLIGIMGCARQKEARDIPYSSGRFINKMTWRCTILKDLYLSEMQEPYSSF